MADGPGQYGSSGSRVVPFSTVNWSPFRLSRCRWGVQSGPLFDHQVVPFSFVKNKGAILHYSNGEWLEIDFPIQTILTGVSMVSEQEGWAVGLKGVILHYQNGRWQPISAIVEKDFQEIQMFNEKEGWILGENVLLRYHNGVWEQVPVEGVLHTMGMLNANEGWISSSRGMLHYKDGRWEVFDKPLRANFSAMLMLNENEGWAVGRSGILHYTNK